MEQASPFAEPLATPLATEYCRKARRVRAAFGRDLRQMHWGLRRLAEERDGQRRAAEDRHGLGASAHRSFGELAARKIQEGGGPVLCYARRMDLLKEASRRGVGRFEANLMIA